MASNMSEKGADILPIPPVLTSRPSSPISPTKQEHDSLKTGQILPTYTSETLSDKSSSSQNATLSKYRRHWRRIQKPLVHLVLAGLILGWWISGIVVAETRHRWVVATIWAWFFLLLIIFEWVPKTIITRPVEKVWTTCVSNPWFKFSYRIRVALGALALAALIFASAFGFELEDGTSHAHRAQGVLGLVVIQLGFYGFSTNRKAIKWETVIVGLMLQQIIAMFVLKTGAGFSFFKWIATAAGDFLAQGNSAAAFFWGTTLASQHLFFISTLASIIFFIAIVSLLSYYGILQWLVTKCAWLAYKLLAVSGAEAIVAVASPFIGQGESACLIKPYVNHMTDSELFLVMVSGFSTIAGSVLVAYINLGVDATTLVTSSIMSIPASIAASKLLMPEEGEPLTAGQVTVVREKDDSVNGLQAYSNGAMFGVKVATSIFANVLTILALVYTIDGLLTWIGKSFGITALTMELVLGYILYPLVWLLGVPNKDVFHVSQLLALKFIANEFVGYSEFKTTVEPLISHRAGVIATYALCGFANLGSLGIAVGVLSSLGPDKRATIARLGPKALVCGFLTTCQTAAIAGFLL